jgi:hypothetical protein
MGGKRKVFGAERSGSRERFVGFERVEQKAVEAKK